ncbi:MAG: glutamate racemase [Desulfobacteraceae bacterium]|nr:MAG: glutamate racemase [Desulfobacteraceae bacterium]
MSNHPIAVFDSGIGGLSVLREIMDLLPDEPVRYLADSKNCPYGSRPVTQTAELARNHIEFLLTLNCKLIVVACNTVTAAAIDTLRQEYNVPFIGMEPALKPACLQTRTGKVGILATENTFNGKLYRQTYERYATDVDVFVQPGLGLVELVESGRHQSDRAFELLERYLSPMMDRQVDTLVLGCTHYPFLMDVIQTVTQGKMNVIDPARAVAAQTRRVLEQMNLLSERTGSLLHLFYTSGHTESTERFILNTLDAHLNGSDFKVVSLTGP